MKNIYLLTTSNTIKINIKLHKRNFLTTSTLFIEVVIQRWKNEKKHNIFLLFLLFSMSLHNTTDIIDNKSYLLWEENEYYKVE